MPDLALLAGAPCTVASTHPRDNYPGMVKVACGGPSVALVTVSCGHEHVDRALACSWCVMVLRDNGHQLICGPCEDSREPHQCPAFLSVVWLSGEENAGA